MNFSNIWLIFVWSMQMFWDFCECKYVEGYLKTSDDWAFLARFCFISNRGKYEYEIEFDRKLGEPQLLLYFDEPSQWPSVYKSDKTCLQKLSVLSIEDNQMLRLSARSPNNVLSGCRIVPKDESTTTEPALPLPPTTTTSTTSASETASTASDGSAERSTTPLPILKRQLEPGDTNEADEMEHALEMLNSTASNETDVFNASAITEDVKSHNGGGLNFSNDLVLENKLENGTAYRKEVEQLFQSPGDARSARQSLSLKPFLRSSTRDTLLVRCHNAGKFFSARQRWWYIAVSNCGNNKGLDIHYRFKMTNGPSGDFWTEHYSADEMLIPPILLTEAIFYSVLLVALFFCTIELKALHLYHCTYRLFGFSVMTQYFGILVQGTAWVKYGLTGLGPNTTTGAIFMGASEISFLLLLLLMAKGYTITRARLSSFSIVKLTMFINTYIVVYITLFVYQATAFDPGEVLNLYESPAGLGLSLLRCIAWCAFMISTAQTIRKYPEKSSFYYPFGLFGSTWLLGGPFLTLIGIAVLDPWVRESVMCGTFALMAFSGHVAFLYLTWPSRANKSFPYHVRTNHVGIASDDDDGADYPRHTYEPSSNYENVIIPLSRRTEELINGVYGQYLYDPKNAHSHASFPEDRNAPVDILSSEQLNTQFAVNEENDLPKSAAATRFAGYLQKTTVDDVSQPPSINQNDVENQIDSGHPSLEHSGSAGSPSNNTTKSTSDAESPKRPLRSNSVGSLKSNALPTDGQKIPPNKIILEPIERSMKNMRNVPRHLFAARNSSAEQSDRNESRS